MLLVVAMRKAMLAMHLCVAALKLFLTPHTHHRPTAAAHQHPSCSRSEAGQKARSHTGCLLNVLSLDFHVAEVGVAAAAAIQAVAWLHCDCWIMTDAICAILPVFACRFVQVLLMSKICG